MHYVLRLYIAGASRLSQETVARIRSLCDSYLRDRYAFEVIDVFERPDLAERDKIIATPTLIRATPPPVRKIVGNLSDEEKLLAGLDLAGRDLPGSAAPPPDTDHGPTGQAPAERGPAEQAQTDQGQPTQGPTDQGPPEEAPQQEGPAASDRPDPI